MNTVQTVSYTHLEYAVVAAQADVAAGAADQPLGVDEVAGIEKKL